MQIECPGCAARYEVPEARLAPGRPVRCARCGRDWFPLATEAGNAEPAPPVETIPPIAPAFADERLQGVFVEDGSVEHASVDDEPLDDGAVAPAASPPRRPHPFVAGSRSADPVGDVPPTVDAPKRRITPLAAAWAASILAVVALVALAVLLREPISRAWPPSLRVYDALHLPTAGAR